jgi:hypothetical protein
VTTLQRILNLASRALDKRGASPAAGVSGNTDWRDLVQKAATKVTGGDDAQRRYAPSTGPQISSTLSAHDRAAIARYEYLLKTSEPHQLEEVHREAFARLTPEQRLQVEARLRSELPAAERPASSSPFDLARSAARGEARSPGFLGCVFSGRPGAGVLAGAGVGAVAGLGVGAAGGLLASVAGGAILSSAAAPILEQAAGLGVDFEGLAGGLGDLTATAGDLTATASDSMTGLSEQFSDLGSNFEIPGLSELGNLFDRGN